MMNKEKKDILSIGGMAGVIASLCCVGPVILVLLGLTGVSTALTIGKYTWLFSSVAVIFFTTAIFLYLRKKKCCNLQGIKKHWGTMLTAFFIMAVLLVALKYWIAPYIAKFAYR